MSLSTGGDSTKRYNIPIEHLDFKYIKTCTDVKELEKIYRVLKSGEEGMYPELITFTEKRLESLAPRSRVLRKQEPLKRATDLNRKELEDFTADMKKLENSIQNSKGFIKSSNDEPPLRKARNLFVPDAVKVHEDGDTQSTAKKTSKKNRPMPRSPDEWARLEKQLEKEEEEEEKKKPETSKTHLITELNEGEALPFTSRVPSRLQVDASMSVAERTILAEAEKSKGNEAFRSNDYQEAVVYYSRSLSVIQQPTVFNNRALAYIKLKQWDEAIKDCNKVIKAEPDNEKALLRRATSFTEVHRLVEARRDAEHVLKLNPEEARAKKLISDIEMEEEKRKERQEKGSRRLIIEESESSDDDDEEDDAEKDESKETDLTEETQTGRKMVIEEVEESDEEGEKEQEAKTETTVTESTDDTAANDDETRVKSNKESSDIWSSDDVDKENIRPMSAPAAKTPVAPPPKRLTPEEEFLQQKELGNQCVKEKRFEAALKFYDRCVELCPENLVGYTNRAIANINLDRPNDAIYDCNMALEIQSHNVKALFRRGLARKLLGDYPESLVDLRAAQVFDPLNQTIKKEIEDVQQRLRETGGRRRMVIEEIEDDDEEEEEEEESSSDEQAPVIREEWPSGLPREVSAKQSEEEVEKEIKAVEAELEAELGPTWRQTIGEEEKNDASRSLLQEAIDQCVAETIDESFREENETTDEQREKEKEESKKVEAEESEEDEKVKADEEEKQMESEDDSWVEVQQGMCESEEESRIASEGIESHSELEEVKEPVTPYLFISTLQSSRSDASTAGELLLRIQPEQLQQYIGSQLDGPSLSSLVVALHDYLIPRQKFLLIWQFMCHLKDVRRFGIVQMFIGTAIKEALSDIFQTLGQVQEAGELPGVGAADLSKLRQQYKI